MKNICIMDKRTDEEIEIKHKNAVTLEGGFYVVQDFKKIGKSEKSIRAALASGHTVYYLNAYCGNGPTDDIELVFTGKVVWKNEKHYEISSCGGGGMVLGAVPAGTLIMGMSDD